MRHGWLVLISTVLISGCDATRGNALRVTLETAGVRAETCYVVEVMNAAGVELLAETRFAREDNQTTYVVGALRGTLPETVGVRARALLGPDCDVAIRPNGASELVTVTFDATKIVDVAVSLEGGDADGDGFVSEAKGGLDCNDTDRDVAPGEAEQCFGTVDRDCNGKPACEDDACAGMPCAGVPTQLVLSMVPASVRVGECASALIEVKDALGELTSPLPGRSIQLSGSFEFFPTTDCSGPSSTQLALVARSGFTFRATMPLSSTLTVSSAGLGGDARVVEVLPSPPAGLMFEGSPVRAAAGGCSPEVVIALVDDAGFRSVSDQPLVVSLISDAGLPFRFFSDLACLNAVTSVVVADGGASPLHFSGERAGTFTLRAQAAGGLFAEQAALIDPSAATGLLVTSPAQPLPLSDCVGPFVVSATDQYGNLISPGIVGVDAGDDAGVQVFTSATCATPGASSQFGVRGNSEGQFPLTVTVGGVSTTTYVTFRQRGPAGSMWRWPLSVVTGARAPTGGYEGYTLLTAFDSRAAIDAGILTPTLSDLRVFFASDAGWVEVDRLIENPNTPGTEVRFRSVTDLASSATDTRYSFFSGPFDGGAAPARPDAVYLFQDDFESSTLTRWNIRGGSWQRATDQAHTGTGALKYPSGDADVDQLIEAAPSLNVADVMFEAWWRSNDRDDQNFAQCVRMQPLVLDVYEATMEGGSGWAIARNNGGNWSEFASNQSSLTNNTWMRVGISIADRNVRIWRDRIQINPNSNVAHQVPTPALVSGNIGFRKHDSGNGFDAIWFDDVTVRRYTEPEPSVSVGVPVASP